MFISVEGNDGSGKTTLVDSLREYFASQGYEVITTREPGGTLVGRDIRHALLDPEGEPKSAMTEFLLFMADRSHHIETVIKPALDAGKVVISDRFMDTSFAYQCAGSGLDYATYKTLTELVQKGFEPDHTLMVLCDPTDALPRLQKQGKLDRYEQEDFDFHVRVIEGFKQAAKIHKHRCTIIDGGNDPDLVESEAHRFAKAAIEQGPREHKASNNVWATLEAFVYAVPNPVDFYTEVIRHRVDNGELRQMDDLVLVDFETTTVDQVHGGTMQVRRQKNCEIEQVLPTLAKRSETSTEELARTFISIDLAMTFGYVKEEDMRRISEEEQEPERLNLGLGDGDPTVQ